VNRRTLIAWGLAGTAWPLTVQAQQPTSTLIGFLSGRSRDESARDAAAFCDGLSEMGYVEGQNLAIEYRWAESRNERLPELAADLVQRQVAVIAAVGGNNSAFAAKAATATIPIVFTSGADPVAVGLVASLNQPGKNATGVSWFASELGPKQLGLLHELLPNITSAAVIVNPNSPEFAHQPEHALRAARSLGWQLHVIEARSESDIDAAFPAAVMRRAEAVIVGTDPFFFSRRDQIVAQATHHVMPTIYFDRAFVAGGGLISYGNSISDAYRRAGLQTGRILKGATPANLPVDQATRFELVINLKTAKALSLEIPDSLVARADEVIE
jgi:putative ABC transport system substrate-binding protein